MQLSRYQEQPQLLDPHLSGIVEPLAGVLRGSAGAGAPEDLAVIQGISSLLWAVATIRSASCRLCMSRSLSTGPHAVCNR